MVSPPLETYETRGLQTFFVHPILNCPIYHNQITISCQILSTKSLTDIKKAAGESTTMMELLKHNKVYLEADLLG